MSIGKSFLVALQLEGRRCLVVGCGEEAARRAADLADAGAEVVVVGAGPCAALARLGEAGRASLRNRPFELADLDECWLVVLADRDPDLLAALGPTCTDRRVLFCAVDQPGHNGFHHVALARAGCITIGVSTDGTAPALGRRLRDELEQSLQRDGVAELAREMAELRRSAPAETRRELLAQEAGRLSCRGFQVASGTTGSDDD
jgi:siroheme synthase-like protein